MLLKCLNKDLNLSEELSEKFVTMSRHDTLIKGKYFWIQEFSQKIACNRSLLFFWKQLLTENLIYGKRDIHLNSFCMRWEKKLLMVQQQSGNYWEQWSFPIQKTTWYLFFQGWRTIYIVSNQLWFFGICKNQIKI